MIERHIIIDNVDPVTFYGVNNSNIQLIRNLFPKLRMAARGSVITVIGDDAETSDFEQKIHTLADYCATYNTLPEDVIIDTIKGAPPKQLKMDDVIVYGVNGKPISGRTPNQQLLVKTFMHNDLTFALGPAGTGKTYLAVALAVRALKNREIRKIIRRDGKPYFQEDGEWKPLDENTLVSMNFWGFTPKIFKQVEPIFAQYLKKNYDTDPMTCEHVIPTAIGELIKEKVCTVKVLSSTDHWFGVTYKEDKPEVEQRVQKMKDDGIYPDVLWE